MVEEIDVWWLGKESHSSRGSNWRIQENSFWKIYKEWEGRGSVLVKQRAEH